MRGSELKSLKQICACVLCVEKPSECDNLGLILHLKMIQFFFLKSTVFAFFFFSLQCPRWTRSCRWNRWTTTTTSRWTTPRASSSCLILTFSLKFTREKEQRMLKCVYIYTTPFIYECAFIFISTIFTVNLASLDFFFGRHERPLLPPMAASLPFFLRSNCMLRCVSNKIYKPTISVTFFHVIIF